MKNDGKGRTNFKNTKNEKGKTLRMCEKVSKRWKTRWQKGDKKKTHAKVEKCGKKYNKVEKGRKERKRQKKIEKGREGGTSG